MFPVAICGCTQDTSDSGVLSDPQDLIDQHAIDKGFLDDPDPGRRSRHLDQFRDGRADEQQHMQIGAFVEELPQERRAAQPRQNRFDQHAALLRMQARRGFKECFRIRIREDLYPVCIQQSRQRFGDRLVRIHDVDRKLVLSQETLLAPARIDQWSIAPRAVALVLGATRRTLRLPRCWELR